MPSKPVRRRHGAEFKAKVLAACDEPGASVAAVALAHDLNANLVHKWRRARAAAAVPALRLRSSTPEFVALALPSVPPNPAKPTPATTAHIRVAIDRGGSRVDVSWPVAAAAECAAWLREWLR
ncbi:MAG: transposase [Burkholderiales bacterium]|nr:transposase [Burkholderiales bacterium]